MRKPNTPSKGLLITLEGIDGSGKTTQTRLLVEGLRGRGFEAEATTEPSPGPVGELIRSYISRGGRRRPYLEALLFASDRYDHLDRTVNPMLRRGVIVVSDRYLHSSLAYQSAAGVDLEWLRLINSFAPKPDLTFYLDVPAEVGLRRKGREATIFENHDYQRKVRDLYLGLVKSEGLLQVTGEGAVEEAHKIILARVLRVIREHGIRPHASSRRGVGPSL